jgi:hypothetical protein
MTDDPWAELKLARCKHLRSKEMFYDNGTPIEQRGGSGIFWCMHTHHCLGPDSRPASDEDCHSGRPCHET